MGIKRTNVGTSVSRAIPDNRLPNAVQTGMLRTLFSSDEDADMVESIQNELLGSIGMRAERMYEYAARGDYLFGLPSGQFATGSEGRDVIQAQLEALEGAPVVIDYCFHGAPNDLHIGWISLMSHGRDYDPATNILGAATAAAGYPIYLDDMLVVIPPSLVDNSQRGTLDQWGFAACAGYTPERNMLTAETARMIQPHPIQVDPVATETYLLVKTMWQTADGVERSGFTIGPSSLLGYDINADYFHVRYTVGGFVKYWMYKDGAGTYPTVDAIYKTAHSDAGSFFPFLYFRYNHTAEIADKTTMTYKASAALAKRLSLPYDKISQAIEDNPDADKIEQAMMIMAVPANTEDESERKYLFSFFDNIYNSEAYADNRYVSPVEENLRLQDIISGALQPRLVIQDDRFKLSVDFQAIFKKRVAGKIGEVGTHSSGFTSEVGEMVVTNADSGTQTTVPVTTTYHYFRRQVSGAFFDEIRVTFLTTRYWVLGGFKQSSGEEDSPILMIPVDRAITEDYSIPEREAFYARAMQYVINAVEVTHLRWYQTDAFQVALAIIAIYLIIASLGSDIEEALALIAAGSYLAATILILTIVIEGIVINIAFKAVVRWLGPKWALVLAIAAAIVGVGAGIENGGLAGAPWASALLQIATGLAKAISDKFQKDMENLVGEEKSFIEEEKQELKLLQDAQELLNDSIHLDPFIIFGETPRDYYNRTVHSGNIGVMSIDAISSYVDIALTLPNLDQTLGGALYARQ